MLTTKTSSSDVIILLLWQMLDLNHIWTRAVVVVQGTAASWTRETGLNYAKDCGYEAVQFLAGSLVSTAREGSSLLTLSWFSSRWKTSSCRYVTLFCAEFHFYYLAGFHRCLRLKKKPTRNVNLWAQLVLCYIGYQPRRYACIFYI